MTNGWTNGWTDMWIEGQMDGQLCSHTDAIVASENDDFPTDFAFLQKLNQPTDKPTDGPTNRRTYPLIEMR